MYIYYIAAVICAILTKGASNFLYNRENKFTIRFLGLLFSVLVIIIFCSIAAWRDPFSVGTDTANYGLVDFNNAKNYNWDFFYSMPSIKRYPILCKLIIYVSAHFTGNLFIYLFCLQLVICLPVYISLITYEKKYAWLGVFIFGCYMQPESFNIIRQYMAEGFCIAYIVSILKNKPIRAIVWITIASLIHSSALVMIPVLPLYYYIKFYNKFGVKSITFKSIFVIIIAAVCMINSEFIFTTFLKDNQYYGYTQMQGSRGYYMSAFLLLFFLFVYIMFIIVHVRRKNYKNFDHGTKDVVFLLVVALIGVFGFMLVTKYTWLNRIGIYYFCSWILLFPKIVSEINGKHEKLFFTFLAIAFVLSYTFVSFQILGANQIVPYRVSNNIEYVR